MGKKTLTDVLRVPLTELDASEMKPVKPLIRHRRTDEGVDRHTNLCRTSSGSWRIHRRASCTRSTPWRPFSGLKP